MPAGSRPDTLMQPILAALPFPAIDPVAVEILGFPVKWYALAYIVGLVGGWYYARRLVQADALWGVVKRPTVTDIDDLVVWVALGVVLGGRIGYILFYNLPLYLADPWEMLAIRNGGMSFHGGFLGAILAMLLFAWKRGLNGYTLLDVSATVVPLGLFLGRLANFVNGELWGRRAPDSPIAMVFPTGGDVPRYPSQLFEAATEGLLLLIVMAIAARRFGFRKPGLIGGLFVLGYAVTRTFCEFFREPDSQLGFLFGRELGALGGGITMGMLLCVPMAIVGLTYIVLAARGVTRPRRPQVEIQAEAGQI